MLLFETQNVKFVGVLLKPVFSSLIQSSELY